MTVDGLIQAWKDRAKLEVERALLIQTVYSTEKMEIGNAELNQELVAMAQEYGVEPLEMVQTLQQNNALDELQFRALSRKVADFLLAHADVTMGTATPKTETAPAEEAPETEVPATEAPAEAEPAPAEAAPEAGEKAEEA